MMRSPFYANSRFDNNYYINKDLYLRIQKFSKKIKLNAYLYIVTNINYEKIYNISSNETKNNKNLKLSKEYKNICILYDQINNNANYTRINLEKYVDIYNNMENLYFDIVNI